MSMLVTREKFLGINHMDADELRETLSEVLENNAKLRALVEGMEWCKLEDADAKLCPLYDKDEPFRCKRERYLKEVGLADSQTLRSCPFCGGEASVVTAVGESWVICDKCRATTEAHTSKQFAIATWNKRAQ